MAAGNGSGRFVDTHALERSIRELHRTPLSLDEQRARASYDQLQELQYQAQVPIWGVARASMAWWTTDLTFDVQFVFSPEQRDSPLAVPHFSVGPVVSGVPWPDETSPDPDNPDSHVAISCTVKEWGRDRRTDTIIGAVLGIGATTGNKRAPVKFSGYLHLTFQGFGAPSEPSPTEGG